MELAIPLSGAQPLFSIEKRSATSSSIQEVLWQSLERSPFGPWPFVTRESVIQYFHFEIASAPSEIAIPWLALDPAIEDIRASALSLLGKSAAYRIHSLVMAAARELVAEIMTLDDGGLTMEYVSERTGRDITFMLPPSGRVCYFAASGRGVRYAGIVLTDDALDQMALWADQERPFPDSGLEIGRGSFSSRQ